MLHQRMHGCVSGSAGWRILVSAIGVISFVASVHANGSGTCNSFCLGDTNYDGVVDGKDLGTLLSD